MNDDRPEPVDGIQEDEYDFGEGVRGAYAGRYAEGSNVVVLSPDVAEAFPNSQAVNDALRAIVDVARRVG
jgi:hypothetical protein